MKSLIQRLTLVGAATVLAMCAAMPARAVSGTFSMSGTVTAAGQGLAGVSISVVGTKASATTATDGTYTVSGLTSGAYAVQPALKGYTFTPCAQLVNISTANLTAVNFAAATAAVSTAAFSISGKITGGTGVTVSGITVDLLAAPPAPPASASSGGSQSAPPSGPSSGSAPPPPPALATTTTGSDGSYTFLNVKPGQYGVAPQQKGLVFTPPSLPAPVTNANVTGVNFTAAVPPAATYSILGAVLGPAGLNVSGVLIALLGPPPVGGSAPPPSSGPTSTPPSAGPPPPPPAIATTTTASDGSYSFKNVPPGQYGVAAQKAGLGFNPPNLPAPVINKNVTGVNFQAVPTFSISGSISGTGFKLGGIVVALVGKPSTSGGPPPILMTTTTSVTGTFTIPNVVPGAYGIMPQAKGLTFTPANLPAPVTNANVTGLKFTAAVATAAQ